MEPVTLSTPHASLRIYNTLSKRKEPFCTVQPDQVGIYLCGPTVYDKAHIGHMVGPVIFDCIKRYLTYCGYEVTWVVNITDVDDKLIAKANQRDISMLEVAEENIIDYQDNLASLGVDQIDHFPRATECMDNIINLIESLVDQDFAYASQGDVYFDVTKDTGYGKLSNRSIDNLQGEGGSTVARKRSAADFALWKASKPSEPSWESPWGNGRPGWHIECSAMSRKLLGETFDIHGGGLDLVFPHHENEIAQSECCHHRPMASYWTHNGLLRASCQTGKVGGRSDRNGQLEGNSETGSGSGGKKMSRSEGAGGLADLIERQGGERIRFFLLRTHYRSTVLFNEPEIEEAGIGLDSFFRLLKRYQRITGNDFYDLEAPATRVEGVFAANDDPTLLAALACRDKFLAAMDDDFNTGGAIGELFELARQINKFCDAADINQDPSNSEKGERESGQRNPHDLSKLQQLFQTWKELAGILGIFCHKRTDGNHDANGLLDPLMQLLMVLRTLAREKRDFATADRIRDGLNPIGITLEDRAGGTEWTGGDENSTDGVMQLLIELRGFARSNKDFDTADTIRNKLDELGITLEDRPSGTEWERVES
jgi:cysteinyl-tRNA synthetase